MQGIQPDSLTDEEFIRLLRTQPTSDLLESALKRLEKRLDARGPNWETLAVWTTNDKQRELF